MDEGTRNDMRESGTAAYHRVPTVDFADVMRGHHPPQWALFRICYTFSQV